MIVKLNIKAIIRVEQILDKPFISLDYTNPDEVNALLYCCALSVDQTIPYDLFEVILLNEKKRNEMLQDLCVSNTVTSHLSSKKESNPEDFSEPCWVREVVKLLISEGVDANFLLNEMDLAELSLMIEATEASRKNKLELDRLWTYFTVAPHLSKNCKIKSPQDMFPFPWEAKEREKRALKEIEENEATFREFMSGCFNHIMN